MKIAIQVFIAAILVCSGVAFSQFTGKEGLGITTVAEAKNLGDGLKATLEGYIVNQLKDDHYTFQDKTGEMEVEIENKKWRGQPVSPDTKVRIQGKMEGWFFFSEFEVKRLDVISEDGSQPSGSSIN